MFRDVRGQAPHHILRARGGSQTCVLPPAQQRTTCDLPLQSEKCKDQVRCEYTLRSSTRIQGKGICIMIMGILWAFCLRGLWANQMHVWTGLAEAHNTEADLCWALKGCPSLVGSLLRLWQALTIQRLFDKHLLSTWHRAWHMLGAQ